MKPSCLISPSFSVVFFNNELFSLRTINWWFLSSEEFVIVFSPGSRTNAYEFRASKIYLLYPPVTSKYTVFYCFSSEWQALSCGPMKTRDFCISVGWPRGFPGLLFLHTWCRILPCQRSFQIEEQIWGVFFSHFVVSQVQQWLGQKCFSIWPLVVNLLDASFLK